MMKKRVSELLNAIEHIRSYEADWDGCGADPPNELSLALATEVVTWAKSHNLNIAEIDADVLGGVAIWIDGALGRSVWISCMNSGELTVCLRY